MNYITNKNEIKEVKHYLNLAATEAKKSKCKKSQRGAIIVKDNKILGKGHNKPTIDLCCLRENIKDNSRVELCSGIHAEQMAIIDAVNGGIPLTGARMYHIKTKQGKIRQSGKPSCTICSRLMYEAGLEFVLWHKEGYAVYGPREINELSFKYFLK